MFEPAEPPRADEPPGPRGASGLLLAARVALGLAEIGGRGAGELAGRIAPRPPRVRAAVARVSARLEPAGAFVRRRAQPWYRRALAEQHANRELAEGALRALVASAATAVLEEMDLDDIADRVDVTRLLAGVDVDRLVERLDLDQVVARVDLDELVSRVDLDRVVERLDLDAIVERVDLSRVARQMLEEVDLDRVIRESTSSLAGETLEALRDQGTNADHLMGRIADRLGMRRGGQPDS